MATFTAKRKIVKEAGKVRARAAAVDAGLRVLGLGGSGGRRAARGPGVRHAPPVSSRTARLVAAGLLAARSGAVRGSG